MGRFALATGPGLILGLILGLAAYPVGAAPTPASLHDRIQSVYNDVPPADVKVELSNVQALRSEAARTPDLTPKDRAILEQVYASALSHNEDYPGAARAVQVSMDLMQKSGVTDDAYQAELLQNIATYESGAGDLKAGLGHLQQALALNAKVHGPDSEEVGEVWGTIAYASSKLGRLSDAIDAYRRSIAMTHPGEGSTLAFIGSYDNLGNLLNRTGDIDAALATNKKALDLAMQLLPPGHRARGITLNNMGNALLNAGRYAEAESYFRQALDFATVNRGKANFDTGRFMSNLGGSLVQEGRPAEAEALLLTALDILKVAKTSQPEAAGQVEAQLAAIAYGRGDLDLAERRYTDALDLLVKAGDQAHVDSEVNYHLAEVRFARGDYAGAQQALGLALPFLEAQYPATARKRTDAEMLSALIASRMGRTQAALRDGLRTAQTMQAHLADDQMSRAQRIEAAGSYRQSFTRFADIAITAGHPDLAFRSAQLASFSEIAATSQSLALRAAASTPEAGALVLKLQEDERKRDDLDHARAFAASSSPIEVAKIDTQMAEIDQDLTDVAHRLDRVFPDYGRMSRPQPVDIKVAQSRLTRRQAVLLPLAVDDHMLTLVLTRNGLYWDRGGPSQTRIAADVTAIREAISGSLDGRASTGFPRQRAYELGRAIFTAKLLTRLATIRNVQVMGSGPLMTLPFGLLIIRPVTGRDDDPEATRKTAYSIRSFAFSVKPAFIPSQQRLIGGSAGFAGIGAPRLGPPAAGMAGMPAGRMMRGAYHDLATLRDLPSLPTAARELTDIDRALNRRGSIVLVGDLATEARVRSMPLQSYGVIAFATHGLISGDLLNLQEPALVLTPPAVATDDDDGLLTASEVAGLHLNANWVILSGCNTGSGRDSGAGGYSGLTSAFMQAGARNLLVSLWPVRDDIASRLSVDTVRRSAHGLSQSQALRAAILSLMGDRSVAGSADPAVWAPFTLVTQ